MRMRLRMLKHAVGKGRHVMKQLHVCSECALLRNSGYTERAGYVLYRALVMGDFVLIIFWILTTGIPI